jgi:transposase
MNGAYETEVRHQCPEAEIVFDLFHVVAKYGREVIDRVRVDEAKGLSFGLCKCFERRPVVKFAASDPIESNERRTYP